MSTPVFTAREVLQFAVKNEREGEALYRQIAGRTAEAAVRELFLLLANEEVRHIEVFTQMLSNVDKGQTLPASAPNEYSANMVAYYTADILFSANRAEELPPAPDAITALDFGIRRERAEELPPAPDAITALDFGIRRELDSMTYYAQARELVPDDQAKAIDKIIAQERGHFLKFSELKRELLQKS